MVAGDSKRIVVIKNISSNLIEEAILILKPGQDAAVGTIGSKPAQNRTSIRNDLLLKEAEYIINQYIKENGLIRNQNKHLPPKKFTRFNISINAAINIFLIAAIVLLLFIIGRYIL